MKDQQRQRQAPVCPSCGQPVKSGLFTINDKAKMVLVILLLGYIILSIILLGISTPPEMRRGCGSFNWRWHVPDTTPDPNRCKDTEFTLWMKQLNKQPAFQVFVGGGFAIGIFVFYWDWLRNVYENWTSKRNRLRQESRKRHKYQCRHCGRVWS